MEKIVKLKAACNIAQGTPLSFDMILYQINLIKHQNVVLNLE
jgi:hypothetical protein